MSALQDLEGAPWRFDFYRAMRLLECEFKDRPRLGRSVRPAEDGVRLGQQPGMAFPPGPVHAFKAGKGGGPRKLLVHLFGLLGPNGAMPLHITEYVLDRVRRANDPTLASFLDVFHHRLLSLFWRAWANGQPAVELDRPEQDRFSLYVGAISGYGTQALRTGDPCIDRTIRFWSGHLGRGQRNEEGLAAMLAGFFHLPIRIEQFIGRWLPMPGHQRCRLGEPQGSGLGQTALVGEQVWDCAQTIRIVCGPLSLERYERMLPGGDSWLRLRQLIRVYLGDEIGWEARLVLLREEVPQCRLGAGQRLGWTSWLLHGEARANAADLLLQPDFPYRHQLS